MNIKREFAKIFFGTLTASLLAAGASAQITYSQTAFSDAHLAFPAQQTEPEANAPEATSIAQPEAPSLSYSSSKDHGQVRTEVPLTQQNWKPLTAHEKFAFTENDLANPFTQMSLLASAKFSQATNDRPYLGPKFPGFLRRYGIDLADTANCDFIQGSLLPWVFHEDPRYIPLDSGSKRHRAVYALSRVILTRKDSGADGFNRSKVLGEFISSGISDLYYPKERNNGLRATADRAVIGLGSDAAMNLLVEFWPDVARKAKLKVWISNIVQHSLRVSTHNE